MSTGLFLSPLALGLYISSGLVTVMHQVTGEAWLADNLNRGKLYKFYWLLAVLSLLNFGLYLVSARWYVYKETREVAAEVEVESTVGLESKETEARSHA